MKKKGLAFETVVKAAIVLVVLAVVVIIFMRLMKGATCTAEDYIKMQSTDRDKDGVMDSVDQCCDVGGSTVDAFGCPAGATAEQRHKCAPRGCQEDGDTDE